MRERGRRGESEGGGREAGQVVPGGGHRPVDVVRGVRWRGSVGVVVWRGRRCRGMIVVRSDGWSWSRERRFQLCVSLVCGIVRTVGDWDWLDVLVSLSLKDLKMSPENVSHEEWGAADEVLLVHGTELLA